jgi:hypothetical protein
VKVEHPSHVRNTTLLLLPSDICLSHTDTTLAPHRAHTNASACSGLRGAARALPRVHWYCPAGWAGCWLLGCCCLEW